MREKQKERLIIKFGQENFDRAQRFADVIDEPNDFAVITTILRWMAVYSAADLDEAFEQVSRYERNNPRRSLYYLAGILAGLEKSGGKTGGVALSTGLGQPGTSRKAS
jgi:hypothetical protein